MTEPTDRRVLYFVVALVLEGVALVGLLVWWQR
jgi:hypothetical protein